VDFSVMAPTSERLPPADVISRATSGVTWKLTPRFSTNCSTREAGMPPWSMVTISAFESGGPSGTFAAAGPAVVFVRGGAVVVRGGVAAATAGR
jgi:hypothetical protein